MTRGNAVVFAVTLHTRPGQNLSGGSDSYRLVERQDGQTVLRTALALHTFRSFEAAVHTLGGIIPWERLTPESQAALRDAKGLQTL